MSELLKKRTSQNGVTKSTFKLPSIFGAKLSSPNDSPSPLSLPKFTKLSQMANAHLTSANSTNESPTKTRSANINITPPLNRPKFILPKLNSNSPTNSSPVLSGDKLTPHEASLQKIMKLKRLSISNDSPASTPSGLSAADLEHVQTTYANVDSDNSSSPSTNVVEEPQFMVDLSRALIRPNAAMNNIKPVAEKNNFKFVDCDIAERPFLLPNVTKDCCLDISEVMADILLCRTKQTSCFGKILCSRYRNRRKPSLVHGFDNKHAIKPFGFEIVEKVTKKR